MKRFLKTTTWYNLMQNFFPSVPQEYTTTEIIMKRIFEDHEFTIFIQSEMKNLLTLCTKTVHFSFNNEIYIQIDGGTMRSLLGPVIVNIFMGELETRLALKLEDPVKYRRSFVDDTFVYVKNGSVEYVLLVFNSFHKNTKFTYAQEQKNTLPYLHVLLIRDG